MNDTPFTDIGADVEVGSKLFGTLGITQIELNDPTQSGKLSKIAEFFNSHPDPMFAIESVARSNQNPNISQLDHFTSFVLLSNTKAEITSKLDEVNNQLKFYA